MSSFWNAFFVLLIWVPIAVLWVFAIMDIFKRPDIGGLHRVLWVLAVLLFPIAGALVYLVIRPPGTTAEEARLAQERALASSPSGGSTQELEALAALHDRGKLTDEEFHSEKSRIVRTNQVAPVTVREQRGGQLL